MTDTDLPNALDTRQQAMLEAMGVSGVALWMKHASPEPTPTAPAPAVEAKSPDAVENIKKFAIKNIASDVAIDVASAAPALAAAQSVALTTQSAALKIRRADNVETMGWRDVMGAVATCQSCALCQTRNTAVFGIGQSGEGVLDAPQVDWLIVGEAPGEQEDLAGEPFVGPAGQLLDNMLAAMRVSKRPGHEGLGLEREHNLFITYVLKCRPPANRNPAPEELAQCEPFLTRQIELLKPKIILAMGKFAISSLTGSQEPVGKLRGRVHALRHERAYQAPVIVTYHPAYLLRNLSAKAQAWQDLLLAMRTYNALPPRGTSLQATAA
jgi:uracil-DNA glycosylase